jgi:DNA-binding NtrC family response regulator
LVESELYGSVRGAFTGAFQTRGGLLEAAHGGTLFLDEVAELPACVQAKLLRVLEDGAYRPVGASRELKSDVRIVAATHRDLPALCAKGTFRPDLFYRLDVLRIDVPPLRERLCDVPLLVRHFLELHQAGEPAVGASSRAIAQLLALPWPGNVRELRNVVQRTLARCPGRLIEAFDLGAPHHAPGMTRLAERPRHPNTTEALQTLADHDGRLGAAALTASGARRK